MDAQSFDLVAPLISLTPIIFLTIDWLANRIYLPLSVSLQYSIIVYSLAILAMAIRRDIEQVFPVHELDFFTRARMPDLSVTVIWLLPLMIMAGVYVATRIKFWYLGEGDLVFDFSEWAYNAESRF